MTRTVLKQLSIVVSIIPIILVSKIFKGASIMVMQLLMPLANITCVNKKQKGEFLANSLSVVITCLPLTYAINKIDGPLSIRKLITDLEYLMSFAGDFLTGVATLFLAIEIIKFGESKGLTIIRNAWSDLLTITKSKTGRNAAKTAISFFLVVTPALAQTPIEGVDLAPPPARPVPEGAIDQADRQAEGDYGQMIRNQIGGQIQESWDEADREDGIFTYLACGTCTYKVRLRERMVSVIELPDLEKIVAVDVGDNSAFRVELRGPRRLAVRPLGQGNDSNLIAYGASGQIYTIYMRTEGFNSSNVPDLMVKIVGNVGRQLILPKKPKTTGKKEESDDKEKDEDKAGDKRIAESDLALENFGQKDFVTEAPFDPDKLRGWGDYELWGDDALRPETVFRDDYFTYIKFGQLWNNVELPTAYVVVDGFDENVNTRVVGTTFIIESTRPLITLKSGTAFLCIRYDGEEA